MKCRVCHRNLKNLLAIQKGIGPVCERKEAWKGERQREETGDVHIQYDGGPIFIERMAAETLDHKGDLAYLKHPASGIRTNVPSIMVKHSPAGFNFGYAGSGPADFSLNVCLMFCRHAEDAYRLYQDFKFKFVATDTGDRLEIPREEIENFIQSNGAELNGHIRKR